eukprot:CAMPEP_0176462440 /NCGR_PEP_ID=MMETSP0127-20121128/35270_1 /TAXON_ID=938130 /ORGANISM="Platyophrya macrostoma, Strain WH" /LENGTH=745 /DNA_ID=CAMNT_0017854361 /DNA_START=24 /DNA_END=2261 /DNA_ORIENTATION=+
MATLQLNPVKDRYIFLSPTVQAGKERECCLADFEILGGLGSGAFGKVYKVRHKQSKKVFALKQISKRQLKDQKMIPQIKIEIKIMYSLDHNNIIKLFNHFEENDYVYLIIEFAQGGQMWEKLNKVGRFDERTVQQYIREMVAALDYCHTRNPPIIHRDIKPENILLDENGRVKLADFGWSNFFNPGSKRATYCGTLDYLAPEMILESGHDVKLDVWSVTGKAPFTPPPNVKDQKEMQRILEENILKVKLDFPKDFPPLAKDLVLKVLKKNPKSRMSIAEMNTHPWLAMQSSLNKQLDSTLGEAMSPIKKSPSSQTTTSTNDSKILSGTPKNDGKAIEISLGEDNWSEAELASYSNRKESIMNHSTSSDENDSDKPKSKVQEIYERFSVKNKAVDTSQKQEVDDLNQIIKNLKSMVGEQEIALRAKTNEIEQLKQENEKIKADTKITFDPKNPNKVLEFNKLRLVEEANKKLKSELDDAYKALDEKENAIQANKNELKELDKLKKHVEKLKNDKNSLSEENKKLQGVVSQLKGQVEDLKAELDESKQSYDKKIKEIEMQALGKATEGNQSMLRELMDFTKLSMDQMQKKIDFYKDKSERLEELQTKNNELEKELIKLRVNSATEVETMKMKIQEQYETRIEELENKYRIEIDDLKESLSINQSQHESVMMSNRSSISLNDSNEKMLMSLKNELEVSQRVIEDLKRTQKDMEKIAYHEKEEMKKLRQINEELNHKLGLLSKEYSKKK